MDDLSHLFGAYLSDEYESWQEAVDDFARRSPERVGGATSALQDLLAEPLAEDELDARLRMLGCTYCRSKVTVPGSTSCWLGCAARRGALAEPAS